MLSGYFQHVQSWEIRVRQGKAEGTFGWDTGGSVRPAQADEARCSRQKEGHQRGTDVGKGMPVWGVVVTGQQERGLQRVCMPSKAYFPLSFVGVFTFTP